MTSSTATSALAAVNNWADARNERIRAIEIEEDTLSRRYAHAQRVIVGPAISCGVLIAECDFASSEGLAEASGLSDNTAHIRAKSVDEATGEIKHGLLTETTISSHRTKLGEPLISYVSQGSGGLVSATVGADRAAALAFAQSLIVLGFAELACDDDNFEVKLAAMTAEATRRAKLVHDTILAA